MSLWQLIQESSQQFVESDRDRAGRRGEELVGAMIKSFLGYTGRGLVSYHAIRVPQPQNGGKYEIDFLVASPQGVLLIEVKNLGGFIQLDGASKNWLQKTNSGRTVHHQDPLVLLELKKRAVKTYLERQGVSYSLKNFEAVLVNTNENLVLGKMLARDQRIIGCDTLFGYLNALVAKRSFFFWREPRQLLHFETAVEHLDKLPTWDEITLHGGSIVRGDILKMSSKLNFRPTSSSLHFLMPRSKIWGWLVPPVVFLRKRDRIKGLRLRCLKVRHPMDSLLVQPAGQKASEKIKICHIRSIRFGWRYS